MSKSHVEAAAENLSFGISDVSCFFDELGEGNNFNPHRVTEFEIVKSLEQSQR